MYQMLKMKNDFFGMNVPDDSNEAGMIVPGQKGDMIRSYHGENPVFYGGIADFW
jgi:hypothetical protein